MPPGLLIVDDDDELRSELAELLDDFEVSEASSGKEAVSYLSRPHGIDVVLLDIRMPGIDGIETLRRIRSSDPEIGVVIFTGFGTKDAAVESLRLKADDYLEKPADIADIKSALYRVMEARAKTATVPSRAGNIIRFLERNRRKKVSLADAAGSVYLSPKYMSRYFKEKTGKSFRDYKLKLKLEESRKLLASGGLSIAEISERLGYANAESFSRIFKKREGVSPSEFRKLKKREGVSG